MTVSRTHRWFDVLGALAGLTVFAPIIAVIAAAVLIADGPPIFFWQERLGQWRRPFRIVKFRSMRDGEVTRIGRFLRASGLDELPQFVNILRGEMSAVGPRPLTAEDIARLGWTGREFDFRWACRPGLTGLAQLLGARADDDALAFDRVHAGAWSPVLDCQLIAWSFAVNAFGKPRVRRWLCVDGLGSNATRIQSIISARQQHIERTHEDKHAADGRGCHGSGMVVPGRSDQRTGAH